jgi:hypothetical protein
MLSACRREDVALKKPILSTLVAAFALVSVMVSVQVRQAGAQGNQAGAQGNKAGAKGNTPKDFILLVVFQAAGPTADSIQSTVDEFRAALGDPNGNTPGPLAGGRREINWDGGSTTNQTTAITARKPCTRSRAIVAKAP